MAKQRNNSADKRKLSGNEQKLKATIQQLRASEQQLRAANQQLEATNQQLRASQEEITALAKFPSENPNPVLRIGKDGIVIYSNEAGLPLLKAWRAQAGRHLPKKWRKFTADVFSSGLSEDTEFEYGDCILSLTFAPVVDLGYVNVYALDITERKRAVEEVTRLAKFPAENPNPVLRVAKDGTIIYSNESSSPILKLWQCEQGERLSGEWHDLIVETLSSGKPQETDAECGQKIYSLTFAPVKDADFVNVYGLDITERKRAAEELRAANQQLQASEQQLRAANQQLQASEQHLKAANQQLQANEQELKQTNHNLGERVKELNCLYGLSQLVEQRDITLEEIFQGLLELIPPGWHYPEITCARVVFEDREFKTANFKKTKWKQSADIKVSGRKAGAIEIYYLKECPILDEGPFLKEERNLIDGISRALGEAIQRKQAEETLRATNQQLEASEQQLKASNQQLQASEQQLRAANQQLQAEVTERMQAEEKIKASLKEKEVLLKEIHHRVKNNMQLISSILNLQSKYVEDEQALAIFKNGQSRIRSMAFVHEKMYESEDLAKIDFAEYVRSIAHYLFGLHEMSPRVRLNVDIKDILLDVNTAIPCALIINELLSNSLKYAFPEGIEGEICIQLSSDKDGKFTLIVEDNGIGFPKDLDFRKTESLGMQLVIMLVEQLEGTVELDKSKGTSFTITFNKIKT